MQVAGGKAITCRSGLISQPVNGILLQIEGPPFVAQKGGPLGTYPTLPRGPRRRSVEFRYVAILGFELGV